MTIRFTPSLLANALFGLFLSLPLAAQQMVWPGDFNNNGRVSELDLIHWGHAYGSRGPARPTAAVSWGPQLMLFAWPGSFPGGTNFGHADGDGDGVVTLRDVSVLWQNQGHATAGAAPETYDAPVTSGDYDARITLAPGAPRPTSDGRELALEVSVRGAAADYAGFRSLALVIDLPPGQFRDYEARSDLSDPGLETVQWMRLDSARHRLTYVMSYLAAGNVLPPVRFRRLLLPLSAAAGASVPVDGFSLLGTRVVDADLVAQRIATASTGAPPTVNCALNVGPVTVADGTVYLNPCFAEAAGHSRYTAGAAWNAGLDPTRIRSAAGCPRAYEPVCGFNGVTYTNACTAEAAGVTDYFTGLCNGQNAACYDPNLILISSGTSLDRTTGVITLVCAAGGAPVCGCDGATYPSACVAEAAGVRSYTTGGGCGNDCIDPTAIASPDSCGTQPSFVCGCNGTTYINECYARAAGVQAFTPGACNGSTGWCDEATVIGCGDYLPNETTVGAGNQLTAYPGCSSNSLLGPDRVYTFQKTTAGDLQIGLEIMTPGLDMDLFLLSGDCTNFTCLASSTTNNTQTNNEGIVLRDAPNGTYYIVVDQRDPGVGGDYRLELSCGYLDCSQSVPLTCGTPYVGTNTGGTDDVSTYTVGRRFNVENNGPETVHTFTITETSPVTIDLTGLSANLELFLLRDCDRNEGLAYSQNPGTLPERITRTLPAGTYYVVVDGYNGAVSDYTLTVDCSATCDLLITPVTTTAGSCGQADGIYAFRVSGGVPHYAVHYNGPVCRTAVSNTGDFYLTDLPAGTYVATVNDCAGCVKTFTFTITAGDGSLDATVTPIAAGCGSAGALRVDVRSGALAPYSVFLDGAATPTVVTSESSFVLSPVAAGNRTVTVTDARGCSVTRSATVAGGEQGLEADVFTTPAGCSSSTGEIVVRARNGTLPFSVTISGPRSGRASVRGYNFRLRRLPPGTYWYKMTDASGCSLSREVTIGSNGVEAQVTTQPANCNAPGSATVTVGGSAPPYRITYVGPSGGQIDGAQAVTTVPGLAAGSYSFTITAADGCSRTVTAYVADGGGNLTIGSSQLLAACDGNNGRVQFAIGGGTPNYTLSYRGTATGSVTVGGNGVTQLDLPPGGYTVTVTDFAGCSATTEVAVSAGLRQADQTSYAFANDCGQLDNIRTALSGGTAPYTVTVTDDCGDLDSTLTLLSAQFELYDLTNCRYTIRVEDANGCVSSRSVAIDVDPDAPLLVLTAVNGSCNGRGAIDVEVTAGDDPYFIRWTGPVSGSVNLASQRYRLNDAPAGTYTFTLTNAQGCDATRSITLQNSGNLAVISSIVTDDCGAPDQIWNDIEGGVGPYEVVVTRSCDNAVVPVVMSGNGFEIVDLLCCDYDITVVDAGGCSSNSLVEVPCFQLFNVFPTDVICGQPGSVRVAVMNDNARGPFTLQLTGPANRTTSGPGPEFTVDNLPAGNYRVTVTDRNGCTEAETFVINEITSDLDLATALISDDCGQYNQLWNDITGGTGPFTVEVTRLCDNTVDTTFVTPGPGFELTNLEDCDYKVKVTDAQGCMVMTTTTVEGGQPDLATVTAVSGPCGQNGRIDLRFTRGTPPYRVTYGGPQNGSTLVSGNVLTLNDLPPGNYNLMITDANGCTETETVTVRRTTNDLVLEAALIFNECGQYNQLWIDIFNGTGPYAVTVTRLCDSTVIQDFVSPDRGFELEDLLPCDYKIVITDEAGCMAMDVVTVFPSPVDLVDVTTTDGDCGSPASFGLTIKRGTPPFRVAITGALEQTIEATSDTSFNFADLPGGDYTVFVTDSLGCGETEQFSLTRTDSDLNLVTSLIFNDCGQLNQFWNDILGGAPPFRVEVTRQCDNALDTAFTTSERFFELYQRIPCVYDLKVTDATGCMDVETIRVNSSTADLFDLTKTESCVGSGFGLVFRAGTPPYDVMVAGPRTTVLENVTRDTFVMATSGDYMVRATSSEGCVETVFTTLRVTTDGPPPTAAFTFETTDERTVQFRATGTSGMNTWDFGDGTTATGSEPRHTYSEPGDYRVCLTVVTDCGTDSTCQTVNIMDSGSLTQLVIGNASGSVGTRARVPITLRGVTNVATLSGTFALSDPTLAKATRLSAGAILPTFNADNGSFSFVSQGTQGANITDEGTVLFYLHFDLSSTLGSTAITLAEDGPVEFAISSVENELPRQLSVGFRSGQLEVTELRLGSIASRATVPDGRTLMNADYLLSEPDGAYVTTLSNDADGVARTIAGLNLNRMYYVEPVKTGDWAHGLSTYEIFLGRRYLLGLPVAEFTSPLQVVATDMNCSGSFSTLDLYLMQRLLIGTLEEVEGCNSWAFAHESFAFPADWNATNVFPYASRAEIVLRGDTLTQFRAIKRGDLLHSANPGRSGGELPLLAELPGETAAAAGRVDIPLVLAEDTELASLQAEIELAPGYRLSGVATGELTDALLADPERERGRFRLSWYAADGRARRLAAGTVLATVHVVPTGAAAGAQPRLSVRSGGRLTAEAHLASGTRLRPVITLRPPTETAGTEPRFAAPAPNPTREQTVFRAWLPRPAALELTLYDALGRPVLQRSQPYPAGDHRLTVDLRQLPAGAYRYRITGGGGSSSGGLVVRQ